MQAVDRIELNDLLTSYLNSKGWAAEDEDDMDRLNDLTHETADRIDALLSRAEKEGAPC